MRACTNRKQRMIKVMGFTITKYYDMCFEGGLA